MALHWLPLGARMRSLAFGLPLSEASFEKRGFPGQTSPSRAHLEQVIRTFIAGYNLTLDAADADELTSRLEFSCTTPFLGFAYEGAGLWFALADVVRPWSSSRLAWFTKSVAPRHDFIAMVGAGIAVARLPFARHRLESYQAKLDPMTAWCLADGYGFHQGFFHWEKFRSGRQTPPPGINPQNRALFDAGIGRSFWWVYGALPEPIAAAIERYDAKRRPEMWEGIGTALVYAGSGPTDVGARLMDLAGPCRADLRVGIALGAHMRHKGGNPAEWSEETCVELLQASVADVSAVVEGELAGYLASWDGQEQSLREGCYLALRGRLAKRYADERRVA